MPKRPKRDLEGPIHRAILDYLRLVFPEPQIVHHSAGEGVRGGPKGSLDGARRKAMGQVAGFPDLMVLPYATLGPLFFEVKAKGGTVSQAQKDVHQALRSLGYRVAVVRSIDDVQKALTEWSILTREKSAEGRGSWRSIGEIAGSMVEGVQVK